MKSLFSFRYTLFFFLGIFLVGFIPPIYLLKWGSVELYEWDKEKGKLSYKIYPGSPEWQDLQGISKLTLKAIVLAEDAQFYNHSGLDFHSIFLSLKENYRAGYIKGGASTITQQVVRMAFLSSKKSYIRKARESLGALLLELLLTKEEILAWYLNLSYFGGGIIGIRNASEAYFNVKPLHLNLNESIYLALVLPRPNAYGKHILEKKLEKNSKKRFLFILNELKNSASISKLQWKNALRTGDFGAPIKTEK